MATQIEWTDATWNPVTGCTKVSAGCTNCYAERIAERFRGVPGHPYENGFDLRLWEERLEQPSRWKKPRRVFVNSMSDLFHKKVPADFIGRIFDVMEEADWHQYQVLTKRSSRLRALLNQRYGNGEAPGHMWFGVSVEDRKALRRAEHLRSANAAIKFLSVEPLLESLGTIELRGIHWVIAGGESGPKFRAVDASWIREVRDQCIEAGVPFFFKQWGGTRPKSGGNELDGRAWLEYPAAHPTSGRPARRWPRALQTTSTGHSTRITSASNTL